MTTSAEPRLSEDRPDEPFGSRWRAERERAQQTAMPAGPTVVSCSAPFGRGGLGRHMSEIAGALQRASQPVTCLCGAAEPPRLAPPHRELDARTVSSALDPLLRRSPGWSAWSSAVAFDRAAARALPEAEHLLTFNGQGVAQFRAARSRGYGSCGVVSATAHIRRVLRQYERAHRSYPLERSWATHLLRRNLSDYDSADRIYVSCEHIRRSFLEEGVPEDKLAHFPLTPDPRYAPPAGPNSSPTFDIVYVGGLSVVKGVPLLVDALRRVAGDDIRLILVGGWGTRAMRRFMQRACAADRRIEVHPGDPLPHLQHARLAVHPSYEDGFGYAPAEALACGVPVIVSDSTGMQDMVRDARHGLVVATGNVAALSEAIAAAHRGEVASA